MRAVVIFLLGAVLFVGCSKSEDSSNNDRQVIGQFFSQLQPWLDGDQGAAEKVCQNLTEEQLAVSRKYANSRAQGDLCRGTLLEHFSFLIEEEDFRLRSVELAGDPEEVRQGEGRVWVQPVRLNILANGQKREVLARAAAVVKDGKIQSLDGMRLSALAPEEFAQNLGSPTVIRVDPVSAAYYSANPPSENPPSQ